jgi:hypothetical protein
MVDTHKTIACIIERSRGDNLGVVNSVSAARWRGDRMVDARGHIVQSVEWRIVRVV